MAAGSTGRPARTNSPRITTTGPADTLRRGTSRRFYTAAMPERCPKCGHHPLPADASPLAECPKCGVILAKAVQAQRLASRASA